MKATGYTGYLLFQNGAFVLFAIWVFLYLFGGKIYLFLTRKFDGFIESKRIKPPQNPEIVDPDWETETSQNIARLKQELSEMKKHQ